MSSHREAPEISKDPVADSTDVYAFVSPDRPDTVTLIANYIPLQKPDGGPNFYEFGDDVRYEINMSNKGNADADITTSSSSPPRSATSRRSSTTSGRSRTHRRPELEPAAVLHGDPDQGEEEDGPRPGAGLPAGERRARAARPNYAGARRPGGARPARRHQGLRRPARRRVPRRPRQRLRPRGAAAVQHRAPDLDAGHGRPSTSVQAFNVHTIAIQVPIKDLVKGGVPSSPSASNADDRRLGVGEPAEVEGLRLPPGQVRRPRAVEAGLPARATRWSTRC